MNAGNVIILLKKYRKCIKCGSEKLGSGEGVLEIKDDIFTRSCKCGFNIKIQEDDIK